MEKGSVQTARFFFPRTTVSSLTVQDKPETREELSLNINTVADLPGNNTQRSDSSRCKTFKLVPLCKVSYYCVLCEHFGM